MDDKKFHNQLTLSQINSELVGLRKNARNDDSQFNVAALMFYRTPDGSVKYTTGINTEMSYGQGTNYCAERSCLGQARKDGHDIEVLEVFIMGGDDNETFNPQRLRHTPCCALCQDQIMQFAGEQTRIFSIPMNYDKNGQSDIALGNIIESKFEIPMNFRYDAEVAFRMTRTCKPKGLYQGRNIDEVMLVTLDQMIGSVKKLHGSGHKCELPPTDGDMTNWINSLGNLGDSSRKVSLDELGTTLGIMRNERYWHANEQGIGRIESAIVVTDDNRYFCATTIHGRGLSKQEQALSAAINLAHQSTGGMKRITHAFMMADPISRGTDRMYPLVRELYLLTKRSHIFESPDRTVKYPDLQLFIFPPKVPGAHFILDPRDTLDKLNKPPGPKMVSYLRLDEIVGQMVFYPAKQQRREGLQIIVDNKGSPLR